MKGGRERGRERERKEERGGGIDVGRGREMIDSFTCSRLV